MTFASSASCACCGDLLLGSFNRRRFIQGAAAAGAAIGVVAPKFADWHKAFWDNLAATIQLHNIKKVIVIDHRDCGAAKIAYGDGSIATPDKENETHRKALAEFRKEVAKRQPKLAVETGLMALDGSMMMFS